MVDYEVVLAIEALVKRARLAPAATTQVELLAYLSLAADELRRVNVENNKLHAAAPVPEAPVMEMGAPPAAKCRHDFTGAETRADGSVICVKCFAPKKANGRPRSVVPTPATGGGSSS